jgi:hypothetical protein
LKKPPIFPAKNQLIYTQNPSKKEMPPQNISTHTKIIQPNNPSIATQNTPHKEKYSMTLTQTQKERLGFRERKREMRIPVSG